jgi:peptide/nickel transport system ATP-binding protein
LRTKPEPDPAEPLVEVNDLHVRYALRRGPLARLAGRSGGPGVVNAVDGVSLRLRRGEVLGLVGESGSGKSTLGRALLGLVPAAAGSIRYAGTELVGLPERRLRPLRRGLQMVFQDPHAALNPAMDIGTAVGHPLRIHRVGGRDTRARVVRALEMVGLSPAERYLSMRPGELSGGQKQRVVIARSTILGPELLVADEPVSMLDMSVRAKILRLMLDLRRQLDLTYLFITHDLATAKLICDRIAIMYLGRIVELGSTAEVFAAPKHPYTQALLGAVPRLGPADRAAPELPRGEIPDAARPPAGCAYHPRCPRAFAPCGWQGRDLRTLLEGRWADRGEAVFARESGLFADLDELGDDGGRLRLRPARGHGAEELLELLGRVRQDAPDEPAWLGVREMAVQDRTVVLELAARARPDLLDTGTGEVACHLFDPRPDRLGRRLDGQPAG